MIQEAAYARASARAVRLHRSTSILVFAALAWLQLSGLIFGGVRLVTAQLIAVGFIWFSEDHYYDRLLRRCISYRAVAWLALAGFQPLLWLVTRSLKFVFP